MYHSKAQDRARGTAQERGYDYQWAQYSKRFLAAHPVCGEQSDGTLSARYSRCQKEGMTVPAECVDHIVPMSQGGSKWDENNHQALCLSCNTWKDNTIERKAHATHRL